MVATKLAAGRLGMVSSAHPLATEAGLSLLRRGGNAFDAAVAVAAALNVTEPMMSGMGGYGTILIYDARQGHCRFLNTSDRIPRAVDSDLFRPPTPNFEANRRGAKAVSTPGNVKGWQALSESYGCLPWPDLFQPAIALAGQGFSVDPALARFIQRHYVDFPAHAQAIYGRGGRPLPAGDTLIQRDLARSLSQIASIGPQALYGGSLGQSIVEAVQAADGFLAMSDLELCVAEWWEPISISYRGHQVVTASPPATSFAALIRLGLMSQIDLKSLGHNSAAYLHIFAEVTKHAFWCRLKYAADPGVSDVPLAELLSTDYWRRQAEKLNRNRAETFVPPLTEGLPDQHTTHFVIADAEGNIVSATQTIGQLFGSRIMPPETGIWLNNSLQYCTFEPKGNPMDAHAGRRKLSGDCPAIIFRQGRPWAAVGTPGGHTIPQTVPQIVANLIDFDMDVATAISRPRISFAQPDKLLLDPHLPAKTADSLQSLGHPVEVFADGLGNAHGLTIDYDQDGRPTRFSGAADPRGLGAAGGV